MKPSHLIVATTGRALARSAWRGGHKVAVLDLFADQDTRGYATVCQRIPASDWDLDAAATARAVRGICPVSVPLVTGSGFENRPALLDVLARDRRVFGNSSETVVASKDPRHFFAILDRLGIAHPETSLSLPDNPSGWLAKKIGGRGGTHVRPARIDETYSPDTYFQRHVEGVCASVLFLADGRQARVVGFNEVWTQSVGDTPFAYGGAINRVALAPDLRSRISVAVNALAGSLGLVGLNGMDFIVDRDDFQVLEINPRPTATIDLHDDHAAGSLFDLHLRACAGNLPPALQISNTVRAHAVVYAPGGPLQSTKRAFPDWCSDLPADVTSFSTGMPVCTVHAAGGRTGDVKRLIRQRRAVLENFLMDKAA
ncbi:MAG: ATP-grasp domain-containing protein [Betaproteobacteria bacterium]|nr:ATP-grasp domain-containing protein [Betaproteobacteria bacterium]